jgi:CheY-like chemotaxis protein
LSGGRILVVDDEVTIRDTVGQFLEGEGYDVAYSSNGVDALDQVAAQHPDVILLDLMMPGMNGREFITAMREQLKLTRIPILVMTGMQGLPPHQAIALGANDVVEKPFDIDDILNKIALALFRTQTEAKGESDGEVHGGDGADGTHGNWMLESGEHERERESGVVLVVERDFAARRRLDDLLVAHGYRVLSMGRVTDELARLARVLEPRAIVIDLDAPGANGLRTVHYLREDGGLDSVAMLVACSDPDSAEEIRQEAEELGVEVWMKPIADEDLLAFLAAPPARAKHMPGKS